jgi:signal transduction histidine kinase
MYSLQGLKLNNSRTHLLRALRMAMWGAPAAMATIGISYTLFEHGRLIGEPAWSWPTLLELSVLGVIGPLLSCLSLFWAIRIAEAYLNSEAQLAERNAELAALNALGAATNSSLDIEKTLAVALEQTIETLNAAAGMLFLQKGKHNGLRLEAHRGISVNMAENEARLVPGHCLCGQAVKTRQILLTPDIDGDIRCTSNLCLCEGFRSVACAPLEVKGQLVGLLQLASPNVGHFTESQRDFLAAIALQLGTSIENARLYDAVRVFNTELEKKVDQRTREVESARSALAEKARQLQRLLSESYRVQEDTQARIAHDMHDSVTQIIVGALYETQAARQVLVDDPDRAAETLRRAQGLLTEVEMEIRRVIYDLHPPVLDQMGLGVALKRLAATYQTTFDIECQFEVVGKPQRMVRETEVTIYRIIQAALQNIATHAQAKLTTICSDFGTAAFQVVIEDDGVGFDPEAVTRLPGEHLGLIGMKQRAEGLKAELTVSSAPGQGTRIALSIPTPVYQEQ